MKRSQNLGVKWNVLFFLWYPNCLKEELWDQHCWSQLVCLILMFCRELPCFCDKALSHFKCLFDNDVKELRLDANKFFEEDERFDDFYLKKLNAGKYIELSFVTSFILTLSHG